MPTITHSIFTGFIGLLFYIFTKDNQEKGGRVFGKEHVIIFAINGFVGPDFAKLLSPFFGSGYWTSEVYLSINGFIHTVFGWLIFSVFLTGVYFLLFRYSKKGKRSGKSPISAFHIYLLIVAGGLNHFGIDTLDDGMRIWPVQFPNQTYLTLNDFFIGSSMAEGPLWNYLYWIDSKFYLLLGFIFMYILIKKMDEDSIKAVLSYAILFIVIIYGLIFLVGSKSVSYESDLGIFFYLSITFIIPMTLCYFSMEIAMKKKVDENIKPI